MSHKCNADRRHRIPKCRYKVPNWQAYEAGLRQRGSLTIWFTEEAIAAWRAPPRTTPGGQARCSDLVVGTTLILRAVFHQPLRQTKGLVGSLLPLMGLDLPVPDHSTLSRQARTLMVVPQAASGPVHLRVDARPGGVVAVVTDGAYDQDRVYDVVAEHFAEAAVIVPPRATAALSPSAETDRCPDLLWARARRRRRLWPGWGLRDGACSSSRGRGCSAPVPHVRHIDLGRPESVRLA